MKKEFIEDQGALQGGLYDARNAFTVLSNATMKKLATGGPSAS